MADFDPRLQLDPQSAPQLWQRDLRLFRREISEGRRQFELHQTVNPDDVAKMPPGTFSCRAGRRARSRQKTLIKIDTTRDPRVPMAGIYQLLCRSRFGNAALCRRPPEIVASGRPCMPICTWACTTRRPANRQGPHSSPQGGRVDDSAGLYAGRRQSSRQAAALGSLTGERHDVTAFD